MALCYDGIQQVQRLEFVFGGGFTSGLLSWQEAVKPVNFSSFASKNLNTWKSGTSNMIKTCLLSVLLSSPSCADFVV